MIAALLLASVGAMSAPVTTVVRRSVCKACGWASPSGIVVRGARCKCGAVLTVEEVQS